MNNGWAIPSYFQNKPSSELWASWLKVSSQALNSITLQCSLETYLRNPISLLSLRLCETHPRAAATGAAKLFLGGRLMCTRSKCLRSGRARGHLPLDCLRFIRSNELRLYQSQLTSFKRLSLLVNFNVSCQWLLYLSVAGNYIFDLPRWEILINKKRALKANNSVIRGWAFDL